MRDKVGRCGQDSISCSDQAEDDAEAKVRVQTEIAAMHVRLGDMDTAKVVFILSWMC